MDDKPGIACDLPAVVRIVVDPMSVEGQGRVPEEQDRIEGHRAASVGGLARGLRDWRASCIPVDKILMLDQGEVSALAEFMAQGYEHQSPHPALPFGNAFNDRNLPGLDTQHERPFHLQPASRPHPLGKSEFGNEIPGSCMPVRPKPIRRHDVPKIDLMPECRQRITAFGRRVVPCKCGMQRPGAFRIEMVDDLP